MLNSLIELFLNLNLLMAGIGASSWLAFLMLERLRTEVVESFWVGFAERSGFGSVMKVRAPMRLWLGWYACIGSILETLFV